MDGPILRAPARACPTCPGTGWVTGWRSAWSRGLRGIERADDVLNEPVPCHRCNVDGRRPLPVASPEPEADEIVVRF